MGLFLSLHGCVPVFMSCGQRVYFILSMWVHGNYVKRSVRRGGPRGQLSLRFQRVSGCWYVCLVMDGVHLYRGMGAIET